MNRRVTKSVACLFASRLYTTIGAQVLTLILLAVFAYAGKKENQKVDEGIAVVEGRPGFKYTI